MLMSWKWKTYTELTKNELYTILRYRNQVFIVETRCPWADIDDLDKDSLHLIGFEGSENSHIIAYARLYLPPKDSLAPIHFGRVLVLPEYRNKGIGKTLIQEILNQIVALGYKNNDIEITANHTEQASKLYAKFGFKETDQPFKVEGGAELVPMTLPAPLITQNNGKVLQQYPQFFTKDNVLHDTTYRVTTDSALTKTKPF